MASEAFAEVARVKTTAFIRQRRQPLTRLLAFLINGPRPSLQPELNTFFDHALADDGATEHPTKSALCQARRQLRPAAVRELVLVRSNMFATHVEVESWHGRRVTAVDGSTFRVPDVPECAEYFCCMQTSGGSFRPLARASAVYDVASGAFVDAVIGKYDDERRLAKGHLPPLGAGDLVVMDRGYPSRDWLAELNKNGIDWCVRMTRS